MTERPAATEAVAERRRARRFLVDWEVVVRGKDGTGAVINEASNLKNLSSRGAYFYLSEHLKVGARVRIWIRVPFEVERWMSYSAEVVRIEEGRLGSGTAMKFSTVRPKVESEPPPPED
jgi:hypothetical protein